MTSPLRMQIQEQARWYTASTMREQHPVQWEQLRRAAVAAGLEPRPARHAADARLRSLHPVQYAQVMDLRVHDLKVDAGYIDGRSRGLARRSRPELAVSCPTCGARRYRVCRVPRGLRTRPHAARRAKTLAQKQRVV